MMHRTYTKALLLFSTLALLVTSCRQEAQQTAGLEMLLPHNNIPITEDLGPGDKIAIKVLHEQALSGDFTVSPAGTISYPYVGRMDVSGKTCMELEDTITAGLTQGYLASPSVSCSIVEYNSKQIFILGEVKNPGAFPYKANATIVEAVAMAGGFGERAYNNRAKLTRIIGGERIQVEIPLQDIIEGTQPNLKVLPNDTIFIPTSPW